MFSGYAKLTLGHFLVVALTSDLLVGLRLSGGTMGVTGARSPRRCVRSVGRNSPFVRRGRGGDSRSLSSAAPPSPQPQQFHKRSPRRCNLWPQWVSAVFFFFYDDVYPCKHSKQILRERRQPRSASASTAGAPALGCNKYLLKTLI